MKPDDIAYIRVWDRKSKSMKSVISIKFIGGIVVKTHDCRYSPNSFNNEKDDDILLMINDRRTGFYVNDIINTSEGDYILRFIDGKFVYIYLSNFYPDPIIELPSCTDALKTNSSILSNLFEYDFSGVFKDKDRKETMIDTLHLSAGEVQELESIYNEDQKIEDTTIGLYSISFRYNQNDELDTISYKEMVQSIIKRLDGIIVPNRLKDINKKYIRNLLNEIYSSNHKLLSKIRDDSLIVKVSCILSGKYYAKFPNTVYDVFEKKLSEID